MTKIRLHPTMMSFQGKMGDMVFRRSHTGGYIAAKAPDMSNVVWSEAQKEHRERFKQAVAYAKAVMADEKVKAVYKEQAERRGKRPFDLAVSDYFKGVNLLKPQP